MRFLAVLLALFVSASALAQAIHPGRVAGPEYGQRPSLDLRFFDLQAMPPEVTFTRSSNATYRDNTGTRRTAAANIPRFDHDRNGNPLGLLMEEARVNELLNSTSPATQTTGSLTTGTYTLWMEGSGSVAVSANTATIAAGGSATDGTPFTLSVTGAGTVDITVTGTVTAFQLEKNGASGVAFATSLITTTAATAARTAELFTLSPSPWFNKDRGTLLGEFDLIPSGATYAGTVFDLNDGSANNRTGIQPGSTGQNQGTVRSGGSLQAAFTGFASPFLNPGIHKIALGYAANDCQVAGDGILGSADTSAVMPTTITTALGGQAVAGGTVFSGWIRRITYWPDRKPDSQLIEMTRF